MLARARAVNIVQPPSRNLYYVVVTVAQLLLDVILFFFVVSVVWREFARARLLAWGIKKETMGERWDCVFWIRLA